MATLDVSLGTIRKHLQQRQQPPCCWRAVGGQQVFELIQQQEYRRRRAGFRQPALYGGAQSVGESGRHRVLGAGEGKCGETAGQGREPIRRPEHGTEPGEDLTRLAQFRRTHGEVMPGANKLGDEQRPFGTAPMQAIGAEMAD